MCSVTNTVDLQNLFISFCNSNNHVIDKADEIVVTLFDDSRYNAVVIGKDKKIPLYAKLAKTLNIDKNVLFLGPKENIKRFYESSDIFLFPTIYEPCSNATLEAASYQNAIITTKQNGAGELFLQDHILEHPNAITQGSKILKIF